MHLDGMNGFTLGRLHAIEEARAAAATEDFEHAWAHVKDCRIRKRTPTSCDVPDGAGRAVLCWCPRQESNLRPFA